jgi:hypothetical protein
MNRSKQSTTLIISLPEDLGGDRECEIFYHIENDGIGAYEFWGAHCYDRGEDFIQIDDIIPIFQENEENTADILQWIEENYWTLEGELSQKISIPDKYDDYKDEEE